MTTHDRAIELSAAAIDWELTTAEQDELHTHLSGCSSCRHADAIQRGQATAMRELTAGDVPATVRQVVMVAATAGTLPRRRPSWTLLAAAALVTFAGIAGTLLVGSTLLDRERGPFVFDGRTTPEPTRAVIAQRNPSDLAGLAWAAIPDVDTAFEGAAVSTVVAGPEGLVAIGQASPTLETRVWVSPDGGTWQNVPQPSDVFGGGVPTHVVTGGPGLVAIGWDISVERGTLRAVWTSGDGRTWTRDPDPSGELGAIDVMGMASNDGVIVVLGLDAPGGTPIVLHSTDGIVWERGPAPEAQEPGVGGVATGTAGFIAFGSARGAGAIWASSDGRSWVASSIANGDETELRPGSVIEQVVTNGSGLLALGRTASGDAIVLTSPDGGRWLAVPSVKPSPGPMAVTAGAGAGAFLFYLPPTSPDAPVVAWTSADGREWIPLANSPTDFGGTVSESTVTIGEAVPVRDGWVMFGYETATGRVLAWSIR